MCIDDESNTTVDLFPEDQDLGTFGNSPTANFDQEYFSPAPTQTTAQQAGEKHNEGSSEVEEVETSYLEETGVHHGDQLAAKVTVVVDEESVTGEVHEEVTDKVQTEKLESNKLDSIEKQLESMGEGSPPLLALDKEVEIMGERSPTVPILDVNSGRYL